MAKKEKKKRKIKGNGEDKELKDRFAEEGLGGKKEESKKSEEEMIKELQEEINKLTTKDIIMQMMLSLSSLAYKKMGLPIGINDKYKDKQQAKLAVDSFDALLKVIMDEVSAEERENLKASLSNLQINFIKAFPQ
jgi:SET domain-containing protein